MSKHPKEIAARAIRLNGPDRTEFLQESCGGDIGLRTAVQRLIDLQDSATIIGVDDLPAPPVAPNGATGQASWVGNYRILERLGNGAMGVVYAAEQQNPRRRVALKVIRPELLTEHLRFRFELETRALARLRHAGIAAIYEAGTAMIDGADCPFFAMELINGRAIDDHARPLCASDRVRLLIEVCRAVEHAHQRGIVHRDLKPANVLVEQDGRPKVLDFGVARALDADSGERPDELVGTVPYMSPEQLAAEPDIDARTDVYALGVILYELLTARRPHDFSGCTIDDARRRLETEPVQPPSAIIPGLPRDLDPVISRALALQREDRYPSAGALADDLLRVLRRQPVSARTHTRLYLLTRFVQRNTGLVAAMVLAVTALAAGAGGVTWQAVEATRGRALAQAEAERTAAINEFLVNMLTSADPERTLGADLTVRELLDESARTVGDELEGRPHIEAAVRMALANTYRGLGELQSAEQQARDMLALTTAAFGPNDKRTADAQQTLANILIERGGYDEAETIQRQAIETLVRKLGEQAPEVALARSDLARILHETGRAAESLELWADALEHARYTLGEDHPKTLIVMHNYASALGAQGRFEEAERTMDEVLQRRTRLFGPDHPQTLVARNMLAGIIQKQGRDAEAADMLRQVLEARRRVLGDEHFSTLTTMGSLAVPLIRMGQLEEAEVLTRTSLNGYRDRLGIDHPKTLITMGNLAYLLEDQGMDEEASSLYREVIDVRRSASGGRDPETWAPMNNLAMLLHRTGQFDEAAALYQELLDLCENVLPKDHYYTAIFRNNYGECLTSLGRLEEAQAALAKSHAILEATFGAEHPRVVKSRQRLAALAEQRSDP